MISGISNAAQIQLICEPNPYEMDGPISWLSTDLRVFQIRAGETRFGETIGSTPAGASTFIKNVVDNLNTGNTGGETFDSIPEEPQTSVLELSEKVNGDNIFNFAIAKVRYRGTIDISNVRVFFRLIPALTTSTNFDPITTYRRSTQGAKVIPLLGISGSGDLLTIPCFAEQRVNSDAVSIDNQSDPTNVRPISHDTSGNEVAAYFGCWLDFNQTQEQFPSKPSPYNGPWTLGRQSIQELMRNKHQCLVAEIAFDPDPIPSGASPAASDKLAQRNLAILESANPGYDASRRILSTFDLQPVASSKQTNAGPDELLIEWGNIPRDSIATIYIPEVDASQIITLADAHYASHTLTQLDGQTIQLSVGGISYVPLPSGTALGLTGILSIDLPDTVRKGEVYTIVVRQVTDVAQRSSPVSTGDQIRETELDTTATNRAISLIRWRRIVGSYQITIPVRTKEVMLPSETRLLSVLRWILKSVPTDDRWYPAFSKYVGQIAERVDALGGDPNLVEASPDGSGGEVGPGAGKRIKVILDKIQIMNDHDPCIKGMGELTFTAVVVPDDDPSRKQVTRLPSEGVYKVSDKPGKNSLNIGVILFDGLVKHRALSISISGKEIDLFDPDDELNRYHRIFSGDPETWYGQYSPTDEYLDRENVGDWALWFRIVRN